MHESVVISQNSFRVCVIPVVSVLCLVATACSSKRELVVDVTTCAIISGCDEMVGVVTVRTTTTTGLKWLLMASW